MLPGPVCPYCGGKLGPPHELWRIRRRPVLDWMAWNAILRIALPALLLALGIPLAAEAALGGLAGAANLLGGGYLRIAGVLLALLLTAVAALLLLQGTEVAEVAADKSGIEVRILLDRPAAVRLLARMKPPGMMTDESLRMEYGLLVGRQRVSWKEIRRVQLWPEKALVLCYSPAHWLRLAVPCTAESWTWLIDTIGEKLGRRKDVRLPEALKQAGRKPSKVRQTTGQTADAEEALWREIASSGAEGENTGTAE